MKNKKIFILLIILLLSGVIFRLYQLQELYFSIDERYTLEGCTAPSLPPFGYWASLGHFPVYYIIIHHWLRLFGSSYFAVRFPSLIFGILSIFITFLLGKKLFNEKIAILATYFLTVSPLNIYYSQTARPYSIATFFVLLSFLFFIKMAENNSNRLWSYYIISTLFALFLSITTFPIIICQALFAALFWRRFKKDIGIKKLIFAFSIILFIFLLLLSRLSVPFLRYQAATVKGLHLGKIIDIFNPFGGEFYSYTLFNKPTKMPLFLTGLFRSLLFFLSLIGIYGMPSTVINNGASSEVAKKNKNIALLCLWLYIPIVFFLIAYHFISLSERGIMIKYILYISIPYYLLISIGIISLKQILFKTLNKFRLIKNYFNKATYFIGLIFLLTFSILFLLDYHYSIYVKYKTSPWNKIQHYISEYISNSDNILISLHQSPLDLEVFFHNIRNLNFKHNIIGIWSNELIKETPNSSIAKIVLNKISKEESRHISGILNSVEKLELQSLNCDSFWYIEGNRGLGKREKIIWLLNAKYILMKEEDFSGIKVCYFIKNR